MKSKNQLRRERKKTKRDERNNSGQGHGSAAASEAVCADPGTGLQTGSGIEQDSEQAMEPSSAANSNAKSSATVLARKYEWMSPTDPLFGMYQQVSARFKRTRDSLEESEEHENSGEIEEDEISEPSKKQLRKSTKPSLAELKQETKHPEIIEWFDADAPYPHFLVRLKTLPHVVQVPGNWRHRSDIPQFGSKQKYEPPRSIVETGVANARKGARLDVDYEKMHASFFSPESDRVPTHILPYGEVVDLKLRRIYKPTTAQFSTSAVTRPTQVSTRLKDALGIGDNDALPWAAAVKRMGIAPGYDVGLQTKYERWGSFIA